MVVGESWGRLIYMLSGEDGHSAPPPLPLPLNPQKEGALEEKGWNAFGLLSTGGGGGGAEVSVLITLKKILERKNTYLHFVRATCTNTYPESLHLLRDKIKRKKDIFNRKAEICNFAVSICILVKRSELHPRSEICKSVIFICILLKQSALLSKFVYSSLIKI